MEVLNLQRNAVLWGLRVARLTACQQEELNSMFQFVLRRLASAVPTLFIVVTISFFLMRFAPGGPFNLERPLPPATMENLMKAYHLDQPLWNQYIQYLKNAVTGDFGPSYIYKDNTIAELIGKGLPYSIQLGSYALLLALIGGVLVGTSPPCGKTAFSISSSCPSPRSA